MTGPVRLQLSRRKGFDLQALSQATNGLPAVKVTRPGPWGNPFSVHPHHEPGRTWGMPGYQTFSVPTAEDAVECFREMMTASGETAEAFRSALPKLRGKNLACWCKAGAPCHADVLIDLANRPVCEVLS